MAVSFAMIDSCYDWEMKFLKQLARLLLLPVAALVVMGIFLFAIVVEWMKEPDQ